jgi:hypothetical protein
MLTVNAVIAADDRTAQAALQVVQDLGEGGVQCGPVVGEQEHGGGQRTENQEVNHAFQGDQAQDVAIAQRPAPQRQHDVVPGRKVLPGGMGRRGQHEPGVAAQTAVPAQAVLLPHDQLVFRPQLRRVGAEQLMTVQPAADQLVPQLRAETAGVLGPRGQRHVGSRSARAHRHSLPVILGA